MKRTRNLLAVVACAAAAALATGIYALFHGYFDHGQFELKKVQWSSSKQAAMVAERSDQEALGGLTYFVIIGDHPFSTSELRHAYYSNAVIFAALCSGLTVRWQSPERLIVGSNGPYVDRGHIDVQKQQNRNITISYENIAVR